MRAVLVLGVLVGEAAHRALGVRVQLQAVVRVDARDFRYVLLNQAGVEFFGLPREQILGKTAHDFFPKDVADSVLARDRELLASGSQNYFDDHAIHRNGQGARRVTTNRLVIRGTDGNPKYLLAAM